MYEGCTSGGVYAGYIPLVGFMKDVPMVEFMKDVPLVEFMKDIYTSGGVYEGCTSGGAYVPCLCAFTYMLGESYRRRPRSFLCLCDVFRALINSPVC